MREDEGGDLPIAYLVKKKFAVFWSTLNLFAIFSCIDLFAISQISPTSSPTSYHPCKVGVVSSGSGATGHCAGANRPGKSLSEVCGLL